MQEKVPYRRKCLPNFEIHEIKKKFGFRTFLTLQESLLYITILTLLLSAQWAVYTDRIRIASPVQYISVLGPMANHSGWTACNVESIITDMNLSSKPLTAVALMTQYS